MPSKSLLVSSFKMAHICNDFNTICKTNGDCLCCDLNIFNDHKQKHEDFREIFESDDDDVLLQECAHNENETSQHAIIKTTKINNISEKLLISGIFLQGFNDTEGHPIIVCDAASILKATLTRYEIATLILYYTTIIQSERSKKGFLILLIGSKENDHDWRVALDLLDKALSLIKTKIQVWKIVVFSHRILATSLCSMQSIMSGSTKYETVDNWKALSEYFTKQDETHVFKKDKIIFLEEMVESQKVWVNFYRDFERIQARSIQMGRNLLRLLLHLQEVYVNDNAIIKGGAFSVFEDLCNKIEQFLNDMELKQILNFEKTAINRLNELSANISTRMDVQFSLRKLTVIIKTIKKLSSSATDKLKKLRIGVSEIKRLESLKREVKELSNWIKKAEEQDLIVYSEASKTLIDLEKLKMLEKNFEKFYFSAMKNIKKVNDVVMEGTEPTDFGKTRLVRYETELMHDTVMKLREQSKKFMRKLEGVRAQLEDAIRSFTENTSKVPSSVEVNNAANDLTFEPDENTTLKLYESGTTAMEKYLSSSRSDSNLDLFTRENRIENAKKSRNKCDRYDSGISVANTSSSRASLLSLSTASSLSSSVNTFDRNQEKSSNSNHKTAGHYKHLLRQKENCNSSVFDSESCSSFSSSETNAEHELDYVNVDSSQKNTLLLENENKVIVNSHLHGSFSYSKFPVLRSLHFDRKTQKKIVLIMREMIQTERDYVNSLRYVIENYMPELDRNDIPQVLRGQRNVIFGNIVKIYEFHSKDFLKDLEVCENNPLRVGRYFLKHDSQFFLYALYNKNKPKSDHLMDEYGAVFFKGKQSELHDKMDLSSYLLKPVQRIGKYALLLQELSNTLIKYIGKQSQIANKIADQVSELQSAQQMVKFQLRHGNDLLAMDSIRDCDLNLNEQGRLLRQNEFLVWEGRSSRKSLRQVFLFDEIILFTKAKRLQNQKNLDSYIYKSSMKLTDIGLTEQVCDSETKFEIWFRKRKLNDTMFLQAMSPDIKKLWINDISQLLWKQATKNREIRLAEMSSMGLGSKQFHAICINANEISDRSINLKKLTI